MLFGSYCDCIAISGVSARRRAPKCCSLFLINFCQSPRPRAPRGSSLGPYRPRTRRCVEHYAVLPPHVCTRHVRAALPVSRGAAGPRPRAPPAGIPRSVHLTRAREMPSRFSPERSAIFLNSTQHCASRVCVHLCVLVCASLRSSRGETQLTAHRGPAAAPSCQVCRRLVLVT